MNFFTIKKLAVTSAVALTLFAGAHSAQAQVSSNIGATFSTAAALSTAPGTDIDFGTWAVNIGGTDTFVINLAPAPTGAPPVPACSGVVNAQSICLNTVAPANSGTVTVTSPVATTVEIQAVINTNFSEATLALSNLTFTDTNVTAVAIPTTFSPGTVATITTGSTPENIGIGGRLTISGGTPPASTAFNDPDITVSFRY